MDVTDNDYLKMELDFELGQRDITIAKLNALTEGYSFSLHRGESPVDIKINGTRLARGKIVDINGTLGVQVTEVS
ncbi:MAG: FliM/FliN family flagellar motor switch protein [Mailhella sp.]|nr:FliM/FliN family flagellar motor switch protein [Mailhella sp.]